MVDTERILRFVDRTDLSNYYEEYHKKYDFLVLFVGALTKEKSIDKLLHAQRKIEHLELKIPSPVFYGKLSNDTRT